MIKIYKVKGCDSLSEWDLKTVKKELALADFFVYYYEDGGYDGTGLAIWRKGKKYGYTYLGHCSCNGPVEDLNSIMYTLPQLRKLHKAQDYDWRNGASVLARLNEILDKEKADAQSAAD